MKNTALLHLHERRQIYDILAAILRGTLAISRQNFNVSVQGSILVWTNGCRADTIDLLSNF